MLFNHHNFSQDAATHPHSKESGHDHTHEQRSSGDISGSSLNYNSIFNLEIYFVRIFMYDFILWQSVDFDL